MKDLQVISFVDLIEVDFAEKPTAYSETLYVTVSPLATYVNSIIINNIPMTSYTILSTNMIQITLPEILKTEPLSNLSYVFTTSVLTALRNTDLLFTPGTTSLSSVSGIQKLSQQVIKLLLTTYGSNRWYPNQGAHLLGSLGEIIDMQGIAAELTESIRAVSNHLISEQVAQSLPADERLLSLSLESIEVKDKDAVIAKMKLVSSAGSNYEIPIAL